MKLERVLFATGSAAHLLEELKSKGFATGSYCNEPFPNGDPHQIVKTSLQGKEAVVLASIVDGTDMDELMCLVHALYAQDAMKLTVIIPWFGGQTMDRATLKGEAVTAKVRARALSYLPRFPLGNSFVVMDCHIDGVQNYFEGEAHGLHLYCQSEILRIIQDAARRVFGTDQFTLGCGDGGRLKWVESYAKILHHPLAVALKSRQSGDSVKKMAVETSNVAGVPVIVYDDIARTLGTAHEAGKAYKEAGATDQVLIVTHGDFCYYGTDKCALTKAKNLGVFSRIICTNTHPRAVQIAREGRFNGFLEVVSAAPIIEGYLNGDLAAF